MSQKCCPECFNDRGLKKNIFPTLNPTQGKCDYCGAEDTLLVEPQALGTYFELIANVYEPAKQGKLLVEWMKRDWLLFPPQRLDQVNANSLLAEILDDGNIVRKNHIRSESLRSDGLIQWESLRDEMMHKNRWFLTESLDTERLGDLLDYLAADELPDTWYRARIASPDTQYELSEMGAPPKRSAKNGRANPAGIPYLYLGSTPQTATVRIPDQACH